MNSVFLDYDRFVNIATVCEACTVTIHSSKHVFTIMMLI